MYVTRLRYVLTLYAAAASITTNHARALLFSSRILNKSRETASLSARGSNAIPPPLYIIKSRVERPGVCEGFEGLTLTSSSAISCVRASIRACVPACVSRFAVTHITKGGRESER